MHVWAWVCGFERAPGGGVRTITGECFIRRMGMGYMCVGGRRFVVLGTCYVLCPGAFDRVEGHTPHQDTESVLAKSQCPGAFDRVEGHTPRQDTA